MKGKIQFFQAEKLETLQDLVNKFIQSDEVKKVLVTKLTVAQVNSINPTSQTQMPISYSTIPWYIMQVTYLDELPEKRPYTGDNRRFNRNFNSYNRFHVRD